VRATLGYFDWEKKDYLKIRIEEQVEVLSLLGDIAVDNGKPKIHAHVVVGRRDGTACGGHLLEGVVRPTLEIIISESPQALQKKYDPESRLALISV
jgi:predicted DNA-binding protein with PD1-like motif